MSSPFIRGAGVAILLVAPQLCFAQDVPEEQAAPPQSPPQYYQAPPASQAQPPSYQAQPAPVYQAQPARRAKEPAYSPNQMSIIIGGGVADFVFSPVRNRTNLSGSWDARYLIGTRSNIAFEAGYMGTAAGLDNVLGDGHLLTHQVSGSLRLNATRGRFQPFVTAGAGWAFLRLSRSDEFSVLEGQRSSSSFLAPFSGGIAAYIGTHLVVDARGTYSLISNNYSFSATQRSRPDMWSAQLSLGYAF